MSSSTPESPAIISHRSTAESDAAQEKERHWRIRLVLATEAHLNATPLGCMIRAILGTQGGTLPRLGAQASIDGEGRLFADLWDKDGHLHRKTWLGINTTEFRDVMSICCDTIDISPKELEEFRAEIKKWVSGVDQRVAQAQKESLK